MMSDGSIRQTSYKGLSTVHHSEVPEDCRLYGGQDFQEQVMAQCKRFPETGKQSTQQNFQGQGTAQYAGFIETGEKSAERTFLGQGTAQHEIFLGTSEQSVQWIFRVLFNMQDYQGQVCRVHNGTSRDKGSQNRELAKM